MQIGKRYDERLLATHPNFRDTSEPSSLSCELPECNAVITDSEDCPSSAITFSVSATACLPAGGIWDTCVTGIKLKCKYVFRSSDGPFWKKRRIAKVKLLDFSVACSPLPAVYSAVNQWEKLVRGTYQEYIDYHI